MSVEQHVLPLGFSGCYRCDGGCVHIAWNGRNICFTPSEFLALAVSVEAMRSQILQELTPRASAPSP